MATDILEPSDILSQLDVPMEPETAESVLKWKFTDQAIDHMNQLAEKARQGKLTAEETGAIDLFERYNNVLGILKSRARQLLNAHTDTSAS